MVESINTNTTYKYKIQAHVQYEKIVHETSLYPGNFCLYSSQYPYLIAFWNGAHVKVKGCIAEQPCWKHRSYMIHCVRVSLNLMTGVIIYPSLLLRQSRPGAKYLKKRLPVLKFFREPGAVFQDQEPFPKLMKICILLNQVVNRYLLLSHYSLPLVYISTL